LVHYVPKISEKKLQNIIITVQLSNYFCSTKFFIKPSLSI